MKKYIFLAFILHGIIGCSDTTIDYFLKEPFYINNSGGTVKLIAGESEFELGNNDTLCNYYLSDENCATANWSVPYDRNNESYIRGTEGAMYFKIEFLSEPKVCLVFAGAAKVGRNDIRYWENYVLIKEYAETRVFAYTITQEHKAMAREEECF